MRAAFRNLASPLSARHRGERDRIVAFDSVLFAQERLSPHISSECPWLLIFRGEPPSIEELRRRIEQRLVRIPKLRSCAIHPRVPLLRPVWHCRSSIDLEAHVREIAAAPSEDSDWLETVDSELSERLDPERPLWRLSLTRPSNGRFGVLFFHHHALMDAHAALLALAALLADTAVVVDDEAETMPRRSIRSARTRSGTRALLDDVASVYEVFHAVTAARPPKVPLLNAKLTGARSANWARLPEIQVREIAAASRSFANEVYLATLTGGLRRWLSAQGSLPDRPLLAGMLVNLQRKRTVERIGNAISATRVALPIQEAAPLKRLELVRQSNREALRGQLIRGVELIAAIDALLPAALLPMSALLGSGGISINLVASHIRALRPFPQIWGAQLERIHSWTFLPPRQALSFVAHSVGKEVTVNMLADPDIVGDAQSLAQSVALAHEELLWAVREQSGAEGAPGSYVDANRNYME